YRGRLGDQPYENMFLLARRNAQESLPGRAGLRPLDLAQMYNAVGRRNGFDAGDIWEQVFSTTPLRIRLSELPQVSGAKDRWKQEIAEKLLAFQTHWGWLVNPLLVPVALEVVIKPPPTSRQNALHDLDNVLRTYLIPSIVDVLKPVSHYAFAFDDRLERSAPPASTKSGVTRYEAWRLPPAEEGSHGFVSLAVVADMAGVHSTLRLVDDQIERWEQT